MGDHIFSATICPRISNLNPNVITYADVWDINDN